MLLYYITDRHQFPGSASQQCDRLLEKIAEAARAGVDLIQLRERDLTARELHDLAVEAIGLVRETRNEKRETRVLINSRLDIALAAGADGVHLRSDDVSPTEARAIWAKAETTMTQALSSEIKFLFGASCHTPTEVLSAEANGADFVVYGPVFEKQGTMIEPVGLDGLREACQRRGVHNKNAGTAFSSSIRILALGGVTLDNARSCMETGAAGIAAIRLFQDNEISEVVKTLRR